MGFWKNWILLLTGEFGFFKVISTGEAVIALPGIPSALTWGSTGNSAKAGVPVFRGGCVSKTKNWRGITGVVPPSSSLIPRLFMMSLPNSRMGHSGMTRKE